MKAILTGYTYNAAGKAITVTDLGTVARERLMAIIHNPTGAMLFAQGDATKVLASVVTNVVTLNAGVSTAGHTNSDALTILYDYPAELGLATQSTLAAILAKIIAAPATEAKQDAGNTSLSNIDADIGAQADAEATGDGSMIGILKRLRTLLGSVLQIRGTRNNNGTDLESGASHLTVGGTDGTNLKPLRVGQGAAANALLMNLANENIQDLYLTGQAAQTATIQNILPTSASASATDVQQYRAFSVQVVSTGTAGTYIFEGTNESPTSANFQPIPVYNQALAVRVPIVSAITATASSIIYEGSSMFRYVRLRIATTITGGSIQAFSTFTQTPLSTGITVVGQGTAANLLATVSGTVTSNIGTGSIAAGTNLIADVGHQVRANSTGAATPSPVNSPATPVGQNIKGSAGRVYGYDLTNTGAGVRYVKFFNATSVTMGTTAALFEVALAVGQNVSVSFAQGLAFGTGIQVAVTGGRGLTNNTAITLDDLTGVVVFS